MLALLFAAGFSMVFTLLLTPLFAKGFRRLNLGQFIRADTPTTHVTKRGTPSMGGVVFITASVLGYFVGHFFGGGRPSISALLVMLMMVGVGFVGFIDDLMKVSKQNSLGLPGIYKIIGTAVVGVIFALVGINYRDSHGRSPVSTSLSFIRDLDFDFIEIFGLVLGTILLVAWIVFLAVSTSNAVNLTDGLDGLAAGASILAIGSYIIIGYWQAIQSCFSLSPLAENYYKCYDVSSPLELATISAAIVGSLIGFLWWNTSPAQIMMGDTGAFALGGALAALAILSRTELLLVLIGGLFVLITGQVIVQRIYFKATKGKRIWKSSPYHHHFEMKGWLEVTIVVRFWIIAGLFVGAGVGLFYLEWLSATAT